MTFLDNVYFFIQKEKRKNIRKKLIEAANKKV